MPSKAEQAPLPNADFSGGGIFNPTSFKNYLAGTISAIYYYSSRNQDREESFSTIDEARLALNGAVDFYHKSRNTSHERKKGITTDPDPDLKARMNIQRTRRLVSSLEPPKNDLDALSRDITIILSKSLQTEGAREQAFADLDRLAQKPTVQSMDVPAEMRQELADYREGEFSFHFMHPPDALWNIGQNTSEAASQLIANKNWFYNYIREGSMGYVRRELGSVKKFYDAPSATIGVRFHEKDGKDFAWVLANLQGKFEFVLPGSNTIVSLDKIRRLTSDPAFNAFKGSKNKLKLFFDHDGHTIFLEKEGENKILEALQSKVDQEREGKFTITHVSGHNVKVEEVTSQDGNTFKVNIYKPKDGWSIEDTYSVEPRIDLRAITQALVYQEEYGVNPVVKFLRHTEIGMHSYLSNPQEDKKVAILRIMRGRIDSLEKDYLRADHLENWLAQKRSTGQLPESIRLIVTSAPIGFPGYKQTGEGVLAYPVEFNPFSFFEDYIQPHLHYKDSDEFKKKWRGFEEV